MADLKQSSLDMVVTGDKSGTRVVMVEMDGDQLSQEVLLECFQMALNESKNIADMITKMAEEDGKEKWEVCINSFLLQVVCYS